MKNPSTYYEDLLMNDLYKDILIGTIFVIGLLMLAANHAGIAEAQIKARIKEMLGAKTPGNAFMFAALN